MRSAGVRVTSPRRAARTSVASGAPPKRRRCADQQERGQSQSMRTLRPYRVGGSRFVTTPDFEAVGKDGGEVSGDGAVIVASSANAVRVRRSPQPFGEVERRSFRWDTSRPDQQTVAYRKLRPSSQGISVGVSYSADTPRDPMRRQLQASCGRSSRKRKLSFQDVLQPLQRNETLNPRLLRHRLSPMSTGAG